MTALDYLCISNWKNGFSNQLLIANFFYCPIVGSIGLHWFVPGHAIDNQISTFYQSTFADNDGWVQISFGQEVVVATITLTFRQDSPISIWPGRRNNIEVRSELLLLIPDFKKRSNIHTFHSAYQQGVTPGPGVTLLLYI